MKTIFTVHTGNIVIFGVGVAVLSYTAGVYHPPVLLNIVCSYFYGSWTFKRFPWTSVRYE